MWADERLVFSSGTLKTLSLEMSMLDKIWKPDTVGTTANQRVLHKDSCSFSGMEEVRICTVWQLRIDWCGWVLTGQFYTPRASLSRPDVTWIWSAFHWISRPASWSSAVSLIAPTKWFTVGKAKTQRKVCSSTGPHCTSCPSLSWEAFKCSTARMPNVMVSDRGSVSLTCSLRSTFQPPTQRWKSDSSCDATLDTLWSTFTSRWL